MNLRDIWRVSGRCALRATRAGKASGFWTCWDSRPSGILRDLGKVYTAEASLVVSEMPLTRDLESGGEELGAYTRHS